MDNPQSPRRFPRMPGMPPIGGMEDFDQPPKPSVKDLLILDLSRNVTDTFTLELIDAALTGKPLSKSQIQHFRDEAHAYAHRMSPELREFVDKLLS